MKCPTLTITLCPAWWAPPPYWSSVRPLSAGLCSRLRHQGRRRWLRSEYRLVSAVVQFRWYQRVITLNRNSSILISISGFNIPLFSRAKNLWHIICSPVWMDAWSVLNNACSGAALWVPELCVSERGAGVYPYPLLLSHWQRDGRPRLHVRSCLQGRGEQVSVIVRHLKHK